MPSEKPVRRVNPSGEVSWVARWRDKTGKIRYGAKPDIPGTYKLKRDAQAAIDAAHERDLAGPSTPSTIGQYAATWLDTHPRAATTNAGLRSRLTAVLDLNVEGVTFKDWPLEQVRRRQANVLKDLLLKQGRAWTGVNAVLDGMVLMFEDAVEDECALANPFRGMKKVRANDPRVMRGEKPVRVWPRPEMHRLARACAEATEHGPGLQGWRRLYAEAMVRTLADCGLRVGELFALCRSDVSFAEGTLQVRWTVSTVGVLAQGTKTDHGRPDAGRVVPLPDGLLALLDALPTRLDWTVERGGVLERPLFPTSTGRSWKHSSFYEYVWGPGCRLAGVDARPHELRHSHVSLLRAAGVDPAKLARASGHTVQTATGTYTHAVGDMFDEIRKAI